MKTNTAAVGVKKYTHEGARAFDHTSAEQDLRRSVMACMLWEASFYESGQSIAERIAELVKEVPAENVAAIAIEARTKMKLRHVPLLLAVELAKLPTHRHVVGKLIPEIVQRADELSELLSLYGLGRTGAKKLNKLSQQVKIGLAKAFTKFSEYDLAKYDRANAVKLRDVLFLVHPKPLDEEQAAMWKRLIDGQLATPDTWEVAISAAKPEEKRAAWERLLEEEKLGALALLRNLRNMQEAGVRLSLVREALVLMKTERVLPFRFVAAARYAPQLEPELELAMYRSLQGAEKLAGKTAIVIDHSGSMAAKISAKSEMTRLDAACALAILLREICQDIAIVAYSDAAALLAPRRGFALRISSSVVWDQEVRTRRRLSRPRSARVTTVSSSSPTSRATNRFRTKGQISVA